MKRIFPFLIGIAAAWLCIGSVFAYGTFRSDSLSTGTPALKPFDTTVWVTSETSGANVKTDRIVSAKEPKTAKVKTPRIGYSSFGGVSKHYLTVNAGTGLIGDLYYSDYESGRKAAASYSARYGYNYFRHNTYDSGVGAGIGMNYYGLVNNQSAGYSSSLGRQTIHYVGLCEISFILMGSRIAWDVSMGLGYMNIRTRMGQSENAMILRENGFGMNLSTNIDCRLSDSFGIGVTAFWLVGSMGENSYGWSDEPLSFNVPGIQFGLRFYFGR